MADQGVSRTLNMQPIVDAVAGAAQKIRQELSQTVEVPVRVVGVDDAKRAIQALEPDSVQAPGAQAVPNLPPPESGRILPPQESRFGQSPDPRRYRQGNTYDSPEDYPDAPPDRLTIMGNENWAMTKSGGAYHTLQNAGQVGRKWGKFLGDDASDEQSDWANAAATPEGKKFSESMEEVETLGKKIATFLKVFKDGGPGAVKATAELQRAQVALEGGGQAGSSAADGLG